MSNPRIGLVAFGEVGTGKSTLCNTLIGSNGTALVEIEKAESQTLETIGKEGKYGNQDTIHQGLEKLKEMTQFILSRWLDISKEKN